ncbi:prepilin-type N-terminal cleavage/methylation domain-containing protein [Shewanella litorisediminis]|uniref:Prepilin-type N-terminal cleavage/methylation domain-containing protein n=1 Tax=Shewanella litorisediminis TaxID=1173586 RepID=A0ABX7G4S5_9GAMM|nr:prepilin-type N-terminal cleavage/methylation domain-containing protein [Shewanella litorisediminis]MCL2917821.1 prepilin-type N-terminal cleavage/methylation domain-containing protein [Shewanella litorisediminis]QRH02262.1 prepilin-type N-terminal cleavage/methylation domain-containing protein [Shewanella litorisediminis]
MPANVNKGPKALKRTGGFTLVELVVGMLVLAIALVLLSSMLFPQADRAAMTLQRVKSAELAQSVLNEIWGKRYDEHSNINGGVPACGSPSGQTCSTQMGPEGEGRNDFDDVDDYHALDETQLMLNSSQRYLDRYPGFKLAVEVSSAAPEVNKLIAIHVTTPQGEVITYHAVRSNY